MISRSNLARQYSLEQQRFLDTHPRSRALYDRARKSLLEGVPMHWMKKWAGGFPVFVASARGAYLTDVDGLQYLALCGGGTGTPLWSPPLAIRSQRHGCQSLRDPARSNDYRPAQDPGFQLVLSRHGGRDAGHPAGWR